MDQSDGVRVLLVDDDPSIIRVYGSALSRFGAVVATACNGAEAAELVRRCAFDVVVSDISMPEMTGIAFLKAVRAYDLDVPVILMTGEPSLESASSMAPFVTWRSPSDCKSFGTPCSARRGCASWRY